MLMMDIYPPRPLSAARTEPRTAPAPRLAHRTGWALTTLVALFLLVDGVGRAARFAPYLKGTLDAGYPDGSVAAIGVVLVACTLLYLVPRTALLGAILLTGYLGGATATQLRTGEGWLLFPVAVGALAWAGLYLREPRLRALVR